MKISHIIRKHLKLFAIVLIGIIILAQVIAFLAVGQNPIP